MPLLTARGIEAALRRLPEEEIEIVLRERLFAMAFAPGNVRYALGSDAAWRLAEAAKLDIGATAAPQELLSVMQRVFAPRLAWRAVARLAETGPGWSARTRVTPSQAITGGALILALLAFSVLAGDKLVFAANAFFAVFFLAVIGLRILSIFPEARPRRLPGLHRLPTYTVLVPLHRETAVLRRLLSALSRLDYPQHLLDIKLVVEKGDIGMRRALADFTLPSHFEIIVVPPVGPQTKPKALNYALNFARGELLTIFDAEDVPHPGQLKLAAAAFAEAPPHIACLQAELTFYNAEENWLTRQFTVEYAWLFGRLLPALAALDLPLLLGGTSNHFRTSILRRVGAWDSYNVTEDADLGLRLARLGYRSQVLKIRTYEEANCRLGNWMHQRARWLKGWMQTWLVHMRNPRHLWRDLGPAGFITTQALLLGVIVSALFHPLFLGLTIWTAATGGLFADDGGWLTTLLAGTSLAVLLSGYGTAIFAGFLGLKRLGKAHWLWTLVTMPAYWLLISAASWAALWQLIVKPFHWNKTEHGISRTRELPRKPIPRLRTKPQPLPSATV